MWGGWLEEEAGEEGEEGAGPVHGGHRDTGGEDKSKAFGEDKLVQTRHEEKS